MAGATQGDEEAITGINVTPLVDITLVLLIIFMVTTSVMVREAVDVELPKAAHAGEEATPELSLLLTKEGEVYFDNVKVDEVSLQRQVAAALAKNKEARAIISADRMCTHGQVTRVIDLMRGQGVSKFAINIEKQETTP